MSITNPSPAGRPTAVITGASGGIGYALAAQFAQDGYHTVLVARSADQLQTAAEEFAQKYGAPATLIVQDLSLPGAGSALADELQQRGIVVDALVNNAGFAVYGEFAETPLERELQMIQLNIVTLTELTKRLLPGMKTRGSGRILNVASTAAFMPGPLMAIYYATKAYVLSFSEALAQELDGTGITVSALCPGPTESGFQARADMQESKLVQSGLMSADEVAQEGYAGLKRGARLIIPGATNRMAAFLPRLLPRSVAARIAMNSQSRVGH